MDTSFYHISERAVERVAEKAALAVPGVRALDAKLAGLAGRSFPHINVHLDRTTATAAVEAEIATVYPAPIAAMTDAVRATIIAHIHQLCGLDVSRVTVNVANVEATAVGERVTWDAVADHTATTNPTPIRVSPSAVHSPVTKERAPLADIKVHSLVDDMRDVAVPAPPSVAHVTTPEPVSVQTSEFVGEPRPLEEISVPAPGPVRVPLAPPARDVQPVDVRPTIVRVVNTPEPAPIRPVGAPLPPPLVPVVAEAPRVEAVSLPRRHPLKQVLVDRPPVKPVTVAAPPRLRPVGPPPPTPVFRPTAPTPEPLKQITIRPVEKYYERTR